VDPAAPAHAPGGRPRHCAGPAASGTQPATPPPAWKHRRGRRSPSCRRPCLHLPIPEIVDAIRAKHAEIGGLVEKGDFAAVWVPAFQAKDLALALEPHLAHLLDDSRAAAEPALFRWCRASASTPWATPGTAREVEPIASAERWPNRRLVWLNNRAAAPRSDRRSDLAAWMAQRRHLGT
jgi:hypothetical protein